MLSLYRWISARRLTLSDMPPCLTKWPSSTCLMKCITGSSTSSVVISHCTHYQGEESTVSEITASIDQGSSIGPASYVVNTADMKAVTPGNWMIKFSDDTYIVTPAANANSRQAELDSVEDARGRTTLKSTLPSTPRSSSPTKGGKQPSMPNIKRVSSMKILGVTFTSGLVHSIFRLL